MAIKFDRLKPGEIVFDRHRQKMGNTTMSRMGEWMVKIIEIDHGNRTALVRWNGNSPTTWTKRQLERCFRTSMHRAGGSK